MSKHYLLPSIVMASVAGLAGCGGSDSASTPPIDNDENIKPSAVINYNGPTTITIGETRSFDGSNSTDEDGTIEQYLWSNGDTQASTKITFNTLGETKVSLSVTDDDNDTDSDTLTITVIEKTVINKPPTAKITASSLSVNTGQALSFSASQSTDTDGSITSYQWKIGSTIVSTDAEFSYPFTTEGTFALTLTVTDNDGLAATTSKTITVTPVGTNLSPTAIISGFNGQPISINTDLALSAVQSTDPEQEALTYLWEVDNTQYTSTEITHAFSTSGEYSITLTVTDSQGNSNSTDIKVTVEEITINQKPTAKIDVSGSLSLEVGDSLTFDGSSSNDPENAALRFTWSSGETTSAITKTFSTAGSEQICLTVTDPQDETDNQCVTVQVTQPATSTIIYYNGSMEYVHLWDIVATPAVAATAWDSPASLEVLDANWKLYDFGQFIDSSQVIFRDLAGNKDGGDLIFDPTKPCYQDGSWVTMSECQIADTQAPIISATPEAGNYEEASLSVALNIEDQDENVQLYYTLDGSEPTNKSELYTGSLTLTDSVNNGVDTTIKAYAIDSSGNQSEVIEFAYKLNEDATPPVVTSSLEAGSYLTPQTITLSVNDNRDDNPSLYFTTDGSPASINSLVYGNDDIKLVDGSNTISVLAVDSADNQKLYSFKYFIGEKPPRNDFREESIYFLMTTRFYDGDPSNNVKAWAGVNNAEDDPAWRGDFKGLIEKLDYIKALGFSAIWITPPVKNISPYDYHGYHAVDFTEIDPRFDSNGNGSAMDEYQQLIDEIHARDMKIIQDIVLNHTSNYGEENLFPMFEKDGNGNYTGSGLSTDQLTPNSFLLQSAGGNYYDLPEYDAGSKQEKRIQAMANPATDPDGIYHDNQTMTPDWNGLGVQNDYLAVDCIDLDTENPLVQEYLINAYKSYMDMGVDSFRVDTVKHINRLMFNEVFVPAFKEHGGENFFIFGENAARYWGRWSENVPSISPSFYSWKEDPSLTWDLSSHDASITSTEEHFEFYKSDYVPPVKGTPNHQLEGNDYHTPDWSMRSGLDQIDFPMHWAFKDANKAFGVALTYDSDYSDATWNVTYVDSHDYAPDNAPEGQRFAMDQDVWAENLSLLFTFRGIPTIYYGSEIEFKKGEPIDKGATIALENSGRAYFGDHIEGTVTATDFGEYQATGNAKASLEYPLAKHIIALNKLRRAIPALQKGQYSTEGVNGGLAFKRRFTSDGVDSMALVVVSGSATFSGVPDGTWVDAITGDTQTGTTVTANAGGKGSVRVYVLNGEKIEGLTGPYIQ